MFSKENGKDQAGVANDKENILLVIYYQVSSTYHIS